MVQSRSVRGDPVANRPRTRRRRPTTSASTQGDSGGGSVLQGQHGAGDRRVAPAAFYVALRGSYHIYIATYIYIYIYIYSDLFETYSRHISDIFDIVDIIDIYNITDIFDIFDIFEKVFYIHITLYICVFIYTYIYI